MPNHRFYEPQPFPPGETLLLSEKAAHHAIRVLRLKSGQIITLFDGQGTEAQATISAIQRQKVTVHIDSTKAISRESHLRIHLAQGLSKADKMEMVIQKAVELGVTSFTPLITEHSSVKLGKQRLDKKHQQWLHIIQSASEQSGRNTLMHLHEVLPLETWLKTHADTYRLFLDPRSDKHFNTAQPPTDEIHIMIGPEGGFNTEEQILAKESGCLGISLGARILRTETAAITTCALVQATWGDL